MPVSACPPVCTCWGFSVGCNRALSSLPPRGWPNRCSLVRPYLPSPRRSIPFLTLSALLSSRKSKSVGYSLPLGVCAVPAFPTFGFRTADPFDHCSIGKSAALRCAIWAPLLARQLRLRLEERSYCCLPTGIWPQPNKPSLVFRVLRIFCRKQALATTLGIKKKRPPIFLLVLATFDWLPVRAPAPQPTKTFAYPRSVSASRWLAGWHALPPPRPPLLAARRAPSASVVLLKKKSRESYIPQHPLATCWGRAKTNRSEHLCLSHRLYLYNGNPLAQDLGEKE